MTMRVLIGTPVKGSPEMAYVNGLVATLMSKMPELAGVEFVPCASIGTYVNFARNRIADEAVEQKCDKVLFIDSDMEFAPSHVARILSHDLDIVGGVYSKRVAGEPQWLFHADRDEQPNTNGLLKVNDVATGFMAIKTRVFPHLFNCFPERRYQHGNEPVKCEYFPIGLVHKGTWATPAEALVTNIKRAAYTGTLHDVREVLAAAINPQPAELCGEDVAFCRLARAAKLTVYADTHLVLRHVGTIAFPATETTL
jgi:hypothetical protein